MDPIFDLATDLSQADAFLLPIKTPYMPAILVGQSKGKPGWEGTHEWQWET